MKTKNTHLIIIAGTLIILFAPLFFFTIKFISNYIEYKSCKSFEDYLMLCSKQENENSLLSYNIFYSKALLKREELHDLFSADSIRVADSLATVEAERYNIENNTNIENDYIISLIRSATYHSYYNSRFGFQIAYPSFLIAEDEPTNGDGCKFAINDNIYLNVSAIYNVLNKSIESQYYQYDIKSITYSLLKDNWFVVSDYTPDGRIFYRKTIQYNDIFATATLYYPVKYKNEFKPIIKKIFTNFRN